MQRTLVESVCICAYVCICRAYLVHICAYLCFILYVCAYVCIFVCIDATSTFCCKKYMHICTYIHIQQLIHAHKFSIHAKYIRHKAVHIRYVFACMCMYMSVSCVYPVQYLYVSEKLCFCSPVQVSTACMCMYQLVST